MGVKGLWPILQPVAQKCQIDELYGKTIAVDLGFWVCQTNSFEARNLYMRNTLHRTLGLLANNVNLIFVLEGKIPEIKVATVKKRLDVQRAAEGKPELESLDGGRSSFNHVLQQCKSMLEMLGVRCIQSSGEAEALCAQLNLHGVVDGCVTNDSDAFLYGAKVVYRNFSINKFGGMDKYCMHDIESRLNLDRRRLVSLAIILGCDYLPKGVPGIGKEKAVKFLTSNPSIDLLLRFKMWLDPQFGQDIASKKQLLKSIKHCTNCQHVGAKRDHTTSGCSTCQSQGGCLPKNTIQCPCQYHLNPVTDNDELEMIISAQALKVPDFPCEQVSDEYLNYVDTWPDNIRMKNRPQYANMLNFINNRFHWEYSKFFEKILPILTNWDLFCLQTNHSDQYFFKPVRIVRKAIILQMCHYEVEWRVHDESIRLPNDQYPVIVLVKQSMMNEILPEMVNEYENSMKGPANHGTKHKFDGQAKITNFFKQKKPKLDSKIAVEDVGHSSTDQVQTIDIV